MNKDKIYHSKKNGIKPFVFDENVSAVFDDMARRSIPMYENVIETIVRLIGKIDLPAGEIYDLGTSTGSVLLALSDVLPDHANAMTGIDNSPAMIKRANETANRYKHSRQLSFEVGDITAFPYREASVFILNYTLQFIEPGQRLALIQNLFSKLSPGGIIIICDKIRLRDESLNQSFIDIYYEYKKERGYSQLEISQKREALENVLIPETIDVNRQRLIEAGFDPVTTFFQWFNFAGFLGIKNG